MGKYNIRQGQIAEHDGSLGGERLLHAEEVGCKSDRLPVTSRLIEPAREFATWGWLKNYSAMGEITEESLGNVSLYSVYRMGDKLIEYKDDIISLDYVQICQAMPYFLIIYYLNLPFSHLCSAG